MAKLVQVTPMSPVGFCMFLLVIYRTSFHEIIPRFMSHGAPPCTGDISWMEEQNPAAAKPICSMWLEQMNPNTDHFTKSPSHVGAYTSTMVRLWERMLETRAKNGTFTIN